MKKFMSFRRFKKISNKDAYYWELINNDLPDKYKDYAVDYLIAFRTHVSDVEKWVEAAYKLKLNDAQMERLLSVIPIDYLLKNSQVHIYDSVRKKIKKYTLDSLIKKYNNPSNEESKNSIIDSIMMIEINDSNYEYYINFINTMEDESNKDKLIKNLIDNSSDEILLKFAKEPISKKYHMSIAEKLKDETSKNVIFVKNTPGLEEEYVSKMYEELRFKAFSLEPNTVYRNFLFKQLSINGENTVNKIPKEIKKEVRRSIFDTYDSGQLYNYLKNYHNEMSKSYKAKVIRKILELGDYFYIGLIAIEIPDSGIVGKGKLFKDERDAYNTLKNIGVNLHDYAGRVEEIYKERNKQNFDKKLDSYLLTYEDKKGKKEKDKK